MKHIALGIAVFLVLLLSLSFGERIGLELVSWLSYLFSHLSNYLSKISFNLQGYLSLNWGKVLLALLLTVPISYWLIKKNRDHDSNLNKKTSRRKVAIFLAVFLGWLGIHRFYIGQLGWGLGYLILFYLFAPLAILLGWVDALRYLLMSDDEFALIT